MNLFQYQFWRRVRQQKQHYNGQQRMTLCDYSWYCQHFFNQYRLCLSWIIAKGPIVAVKLREIWVLPSPKKIKPIIQNEGTIGTASIKSLCLISTIPVHFNHSTIKESSVVCFHFPHFYFPYKFVVFQRNLPQLDVLYFYTMKGHQHREICHQREQNNLKRDKTFFGSVSTSVIPSRPGRSRTSNPFV